MTAPRRTMTLERVYQARIEDVWDLWTTKAGLESWWGPEGFETRVRALDLREGGELHYAMIATEKPQVAFMKQAGLPLITEVRLTYTEVTPRTRLSYEHLADFIPGVQPYRVACTVDFHQREREVRMVLAFQAMHDDEWTRRSVMGWESQLGKLARRLA
jgi:uncharacterized protein YndB with AHSA1/START domain